MQVFWYNVLHTTQLPTTIGMQSHCKHNPTQTMFPILRGGPVGMTNEEKATIEREGKDEELN